MTAKSTETRNLECQLSKACALLDTLGSKDDIFPDLIAKNVGRVDWVTSVEAGTEVLLETLYGLHTASFELQQKEPTYLSISLIDLKIVHRLLSTIVVACIYPALPPDVGLPLEQRLKLKVKPQHYTSRLNPSILKKVIGVFFKILSVDGDIANLLISDQYSSDVFCAISALSFDPSASEYHKEYRRLLTQFNDKIGAYQLICMLTNLLNTPCAPWLKAVASRTLAMIPLARQTNGISSMIDFITGIRRSPEVSTDEIDRACYILANVPKGIDSERYYSSVGHQLIGIISTEKSDILVRTTSRIVSRLHSLRPDLAWRYVIGPISESINSPSSLRKESRYSSHQVDITIRFISRLMPFISESTKLEILKPYSVRLLWSYALVRKSRKRPTEPIIALLASYFAIGDPIVTDILCRIADGLGSGNEFSGWRPYNSDDGGVGIEYLTQAENGLVTDETQPMSLEKIEMHLQLFIDLLGRIKGNDKVISQIFLNEVRHWLGRRHDMEISPFRMFAGLRVLETIVDKLRDDLVKSSTEMLSMVEGVISDYASGFEDLKFKENSDKVTMNELGSIAETVSIQDDSDDEDVKEEEDFSESQMVCLAFSLLKAILHDSNELPRKDKELITGMTENIRLIAAKASGQVYKDAQSVMELLKYFDGPLSDPERAASRDKLKLALHNLEDPSPPVRAYGLHLLTLLVEKKDPIVDTSHFAGLFSSQLSNEDSYVYLNAIKGLKAMADVYGSSVVEYLLSMYRDGKINVEVRLRVGEALLGTIERLGQFLDSYIGKKIVETSLTCANRHGVTEDVRIRTSALSILGKGFETNPSGLVRYVAECLDCAIGILKVENGPEFIPIWRASLVLIASILKGNDMHVTNDMRRELYLVVRYRRDKDDDELVRIQARQVLDLLGEVVQNQLLDKLSMLTMVPE